MNYSGPGDATVTAIDPAQGAEVEEGTVITFTVHGLVLGSNLGRLVMHGLGHGSLLLAGLFRVSCERSRW